MIEVKRQPFVRAERSKMNRMLARLAGLGAAAAWVISGLITVAYADSLQSTHYRFDESSVGGGGLIQSNSTNYQSAGDSIGDTAVGNSASTNFQTESGNTTTGDPALSFSINNGSASFGSFSPGGAAVATSSFQVSNYTSYGYVVQIVGSPPKNNGHTITAMSSTGPSQAGTEQFGINLVANTSPTSVGTNPDHGLFGVGSASSNYGTSNNYRYVSGETIASAPKSSGVTTYTISYIVNVNSLTPGGQYTSNQQLICTGTY
ncbi:MAG TPA: hypothetical protein VLG13_01935 [Patescibacteria group bacterium]|nr:hypothetical protein [Patescibacteria group bacterium]